MNILNEFKKTLNEIELVEFSKFEDRLLIFLEKYKESIFSDILKDFYDFSINKLKNKKTNENNKEKANNFKHEDFINPNIKEYYNKNESEINKIILDKIKEELKNIMDNKNGKN